MQITIVAKSGERVSAPAERWLCGLIALLDDKQMEKLCQLVAARIELGGPQGHIIKVPGIGTQETIGVPGR